MMLCVNSRFWQILSWNGFMAAMCASTCVVVVVDACWNAEDRSFFVQSYPVVSSLDDSGEGGPSSTSVCTSALHGAEASPEPHKDVCSGLPCGEVAAARWAQEHVREVGKGEGGCHEPYFSLSPHHSHWAPNTPCRLSNQLSSFNLTSICIPTVEIVRMSLIIQPLVAVRPIGSPWSPHQGGSKTTIHICTSMAQNVIPQSIEALTDLMT